uniref:Putative secreted protein n=1 Tax=Anopheles darlingi TaxID=43151 RepID=A0A2M4D3Y3_ANODA
MKSGIVSVSIIRLLAAAAVVVVLDALLVLLLVGTDGICIPPPPTLSSCEAVQEGMSMPWIFDIISL